MRYNVKHVIESSKRVENRLFDIKSIKEKDSKYDKLTFDHESDDGFLILPVIRNHPKGISSYGVVERDFRCLEWISCAHRFETWIPVALSGGGIVAGQRDR